MADRRLHLEMIQGIINRLSNNSFLLKGWSVILVAAIFSLADINHSKQMFILAYFPAFAFWGLDAYFLRQERLFRKLYDSVREKKVDVSYSMNTSEFENEVSYSDAFISKTMLWFHGTLLITLFIVTLITFIGDANGT